MTLRDVLDRMKRRRLDLSDGFLYVLSAALNWFDDGPVETRTADHIGDMMLRLRNAGKTSETIRRYRYAILYLLADAGTSVDPKQCRPPKKVKRRPTAWSQTQLSLLVRACRDAPWRNGWGPPHWEALTLACYDTGLRIGSLLTADMAHLDSSTNTLHIRGERMKGKEDAIQRLHPETVRLILSLPRSDSRVFPWPFHRRSIWIHFGKILEAAGLPSSPRDKFHKIRRTSYTLVALKYGKEVAGEHATHHTDMSEHYFDTSFMPKPNPLDALPRPQ